MPIPPRLRPLVLGAFARAVGADAGEAAEPLAAYPSLNAFFVRRLRPDARRWPDDAGVIASPVDGTLGALGVVEDGSLLQAKGLRYPAAMLLGDASEAARYDGGAFLTLYLSPRHYHRIHAPADGMIPLARHLPGWLLPVNRAAAAHVPELFARNERLVCALDGACGRIAVVAVGAYNVGRISAAFDPGWGEARGEARSVTNRPGPGAAVETRRYDPPRQIVRGAELMAFHLGSTVVLLFEPGRVEPRAGLAPGQEVRLGEPIARLKGAMEPAGRDRVQPEAG